ncbi:protein FAM177A1 [Gouania willdenowi]|uniref:Family with sequence similarity 177 member A1 n=1 Tax=Gouania willdenowi TaxID=441366 RepID=A0A8C5GMR5_GOUWI|nr:protein FAM177A1 [Gouania willdenowi]
MADLSLYLAYINISLAQTMEADKSAGGDCEAVQMDTAVDRQVNVKTPLRTIYFASGETMEEFSTDEEEEEAPMRKQVSNVDMSKLNWGPYFWFHMWRMAKNTISVCDYMGEKLASLFGISSPKYQYAIDEYYRIKKEEEEEEEENRLAEEAELRFVEQQRGEDSAATVEQPEPSAASFVNISFELAPEPLRKTESNRVPSPLPS